MIQSIEVTRYYVHIRRILVPHFSRETFSFKMRSFLVLLCTFTSSKAYEPSTLDCSPRYHHWRPFFGEFPADKFTASVDFLDRKLYITKIIPRDHKRSWTFSTQLIFDYALFAYEEHEPLRIDRFLEIMCVSPKYVDMFRWKLIRRYDDMHNLEQNCCLVKGGIVKWQDRIIQQYIGRVFANTTYYIGPAFFVENWWFRKGMWTMEGERVMHFLEGFEVLTYKCLGT